MKNHLLCYFQIILLLASIPETKARTAFIPQVVRTRPQFSRASTIATTAPSRRQKGPSALAPLVDIPMRRLKLPRFAVGREYVVVPLKINGEGPFPFILDTGLTIELITPHLKHTLEIDDGTKKPSVIEGLATGGTTAKEQVVELSGASICGEENELKLPTLDAAVTHFAQETMDPKFPVGGMLGEEFLELFDVDLDFPAGRVRFWAPGTAASEAERQGLVEIPIGVINESLLLGTRITGKPATGKSKPGPTKQPFIGIIDSGATFSAVNWEAAKLLGLAPKSHILKYLGSPGIMAVGIDNKPLYIPTKKVEFTFCGEPITKNEKGEIVEFTPPPSKWQPWKPVLAGIGDLPIFELLLGSDKEPFHLPAAVIGLDVLSQRRVILEASSDTSERHRRMFVSPE